MTRDTGIPSDEFKEDENNPADEIEEIDSAEEWERQKEENYLLETAGPPDFGNEDPEDDSEDAHDYVLKINENAE